MVEPETFTLNPRVVAIMCQIHRLQEQCQHHYVDGACEFCYVEEP